MKMVFPGINQVFDCENGEEVWSLVIENQNLFYGILSDIRGQIEGIEGKVVLSEKNNLLSIAKTVELLIQFVSFEINQKQLISKVISKLGQIAVDEMHYGRTMELLGEIESYFTELAFELTGNIEFTKLGAEGLLKGAGVQFCDDYEQLGEKIIDYMELVSEYDREKLFIFVNLRSYISDAQMEEFLETALARGYQMLLLESCEHPLLPREKRYIVDADLCEIW